MVWATFWGIFSQTHLVALVIKRLKIMYEKLRIDPKPKRPARKTERQTDKHSGKGLKKF
jgi:hypothetical protein